MDIKLKKSKKDNLEKDKDLEVAENISQENDKIDNLQDDNTYSNEYDELDNNKYDELDNNDIDKQKNNANSIVPKDEHINDYSYLRNLLAGIIVIVLAVVTFSSYGGIKQLLKQNNTEIYSYNISENSPILPEYSNVLYKKYIMGKNPDIQNYSDIFIEKYSSNDDYNKHVQEKLKDTIDSWEMNISKNYKNLDYTILDENYKNVMSNCDDDMYKYYKDNQMEKLSDDYDWYEVVQYGIDGKSVLNDYVGNYSNVRYFNSDFLKSTINSEYSKYFPNVNSNINYDNNSNTKKDQIEVKPIKNMTFIYGIKKVLKYNDNISKYITSEQYSMSGNDQNVAMIIACIIFVVMVISVLIPYKYAKRVTQGRMLFNIPLEINCVIIGIVGFIVVSLFYLSMMVSINGNAYRYLLNSYNINEKSATAIIGVCNIVFLFFAYNFIFTGITYIKHIFRVGFIKYFKRNSIIFILSRTMKNCIKKIFRSISSVDFNDKLDRGIFKLVFVNFIVLSAISIIWEFGIGAAAIYSIVVFILLRNYIIDLKKKYKILLDATNRIAEGNLNIDINEDLDMFNPLRDQLKRIQVGLRKAVSKEVHSERMKTELISNVSHDLKTPLTSIITYTDLLKHGNPTKEEQEKYINTIDKKSRRLKELIEDLFDVSKATSGDIKLNKMDIDIIGLIKQTEIEYEDSLKKSNLIIKNNFPKGKVVLNIDGEKTYRIFANLIGNAAKYSMPNSRVYVDINNYFDRVEIIMKNTSISEMNFSESEITERFVRGDKSRNTEGSGLGLAIVKSFTEIQNGKLYIKIDGDLFKAIIVFKK